MPKFGIEPDAAIFQMMATLVRSSKATKYISEILEAHNAVCSANPTVPPLRESILGDLVGAIRENGDVKAAEELFSYAEKNLSKVKIDIIHCTQLMETFRSKNRMNDAIDLLNRLSAIDVSPNIITFKSLLAGCAESSQYSLGLQVYEKFIKSSLPLDSMIFALILKLLAKTSRIDEMMDKWQYVISLGEESRQILRIEAWTTMIDGLGKNGRTQEAIDKFNEMIKFGIKPNNVTFLVVLNACSHAGLISEATKLIQMMNEYNVPQDCYHRTCLVDALGRSGQVEEAFKIAEAEMPPKIVMWMAVLSATRTHNNLDIAEKAFRAIENIDKNSGPYSAACVIMDQMYEKIAHSDKNILVYERPPKIPGITQVEVNGETVSFFAHDPIIDEDDRLKQELILLQEQIQSQGHTPDLSLVRNRDRITGIALSNEAKEWSLCTHSERIALAYALIHTPLQHEPIRMTKNLRICPDCHETTKLISKIRQREIFMGDANRNHHFKDGKCSCNDYW